MEKKPAAKKDSSKILEGIIRKLVKEEMGKSGTKKTLKEDTLVLYNEFRDIIRQHVSEPGIAAHLLDDINQVLKKYRQYLD